MKELKKNVISSAYNEFGKIYIHSLPHPKLVVGERGLINNEKNNGIVLAIGSASCSEFRLEDDFIFAKLRFNGIWEDVFIPYEAVDVILNDLHQPKCVLNFPVYPEENVINNSESSDTKTPKKRAVIVRPDFTNSKKAE